MKNINWKFSKKFGSHWIKVKFYNTEPDLKVAKVIKGVRFCEVVKKAIEYPIIIDKESLTCLGAKFVFGWDSQDKNKILDLCQKKRQVQREALISIFSKSPFLKKPFKYIGLNTECSPDLLISYLSPEQVSKIIRTYQNKLGKILSVSLTSMTPVCGGVAVKTYLNKNINISFGCRDSRKFAGLEMYELAIGIHKRLFKYFV